MLKLAGVNVTPCPPQTDPLNCVAVPGRVTAAFVVFIVFLIAVAIFTLVCQVKIITKAGYSGWYVLTGFVPILGFVMFLIFAFGKWPIQERLERAERGMGRGYPPPPPSPSTGYPGMPGPGGGGAPLVGGGPGPGPAPAPRPGGAPPAGIPAGSLYQQPSAGGPGPVAVAVAVGGQAGGQPGGETGVIYCSWCGKERAINAQAVHHCGSMERPVVYCMSCGTPLDGASSCASCGTPASKISR